MATKARCKSRRSEIVKGHQRVVRVSVFIFECDSEPFRDINIVIERVQGRMTETTKTNKKVISSFSFRLP
jgi:hypothetical protein